MSSAPSSQDQPLGLTVHTLPEPLNTGAQAASRTRMGRLKMLVVLLICAAPVIASYLTFYVVRPEGRRNFGELIDPQRSLPDVAGSTLDGKTVNLKELKGQWLLVSVSPAACAQQCARHLYLQRQLREGLGKEKDRLDWVWLVSDASVVPTSSDQAPAGSWGVRGSVGRWARLPSPARRAGRSRPSSSSRRYGRWWICTC